MTKRSGVVGATALLLLLGFTARAGAQQDQQGGPQTQDHPAQVDTQQHARAPKRVTPARGKKPQHARAQKLVTPARATKPQHASAQKQVTPARAAKPQHAMGQGTAHATQLRGQQQQTQGRRKPQLKPERSPATRPSSRPQPVPQGEQRGVWQQHRAQNWRSQHQTWQERGGYHDYRIPEDRYRASLGADHAFRIYRYPLTVVRGYPRFQYGGFWFTVVDPWPEYWSNDWYQTDEVYIEYSGDGYYLYDRSHPGDRIAISVSIY